MAAVIVIRDDWDDSLHVCFMLTYVNIRASHMENWDEPIRKKKHWRLFELSANASNWDAFHCNQVRQNCPSTRILNILAQRCEKWQPSSVYHHNPLLIGTNQFFDWIFTKYSTLSEKTPCTLHSFDILWMQFTYLNDLLRPMNTLLP